jgi:hypothetical protein
LPPASIESLGCGHSSLFKSRKKKEASLKESLKTIGEIFPMFKMELVVRQGKFGPEIIDEISKEFDVAKNNIFIGAPEEKHAFSIQNLGGVRVIF